MTDAQPLCVVEDAFFISGRGLVVIAGRWPGGSPRPGDRVELRTNTGDRYAAQVTSVEIRGTGPRGEGTADVEIPGSVLLAGVGPGVVKAGDEVWPAPGGPAPGVPAAPGCQAAWWRRLFHRGN